MSKHEKTSANKKTVVEKGDRSHDINGKTKYGCINGKTYSEVKQKRLGLKMLSQRCSEKQDGKATI